MSYLDVHCYYLYTAQIDFMGSISWPFSVFVHNTLYDHSISVMSSLILKYTICLGKD